jgi:undecaprenyl-diphosphatase
MQLTIVRIIILAVIQGLAELLPVSSSAHVIVAEKFMGLDPSDPRMTLLLVMLHTGTMFAVIAYFWKAWKRAFFSSSEAFFRFAVQVAIATAATGIIGFGLKMAIEKYLQHLGHNDAEVEDLFGQTGLIAASLAAVGVLILISGFHRSRRARRSTITSFDSIPIGIIQGLALPFRGFSRSGSTISCGLLRNLNRQRVEEFSFALAVVLTPVVVFLEVKRLLHPKHGSPLHIDVHVFTPSLLGMLFSFIAGLVALKLLSQLLAHGKWWVFEVYCLIAAAAIYWMHMHGQV